MKELFFDQLNSVILRKLTSAFMKNIVYSFLVLVFFHSLLFMEAIGQTTFYSQNFGTVSGVFPAGWTTSGSQGISGWITNGANPSSSYTGASGSMNSRTGTSATTMTLTFSHNLSTVGFTGISVIWGGRRTASQSSPVFEWSSDSITWNSVSFTDVSANSTWTLVNGGTRISLPAGANGCTSLRFRWTINVSSAGSQEYRIDDFNVQGACTQSIAASAITWIQDTICIGNPVTINLLGGALGTQAKWTWYSGSCGGIFLGTGSSITLSPSGNTNFYCRAEGPCNTTNCIHAYMVVNPIPPVPVISAASATTFCYGDSVILSTTTGSGIGYEWFLNSNIMLGNNPSIVVKTSGVYSVFAEYGYGYGTNCGVFSSTVTVTVLPLPIATVTPQSAITFCSGGSVVLNSSTGTGFSYQWMKNGSNLEGGSTSSYTADSSGYYYVLITNSNFCSATSSPVYVTVNPIPSAINTALGSTTFCPGDSVSLSASLCSLCSYQWYNNGSALTGETSNIIHVHTAGNYNFFVQDLYCSNTSGFVSTSLLSASQPADSISANSLQVCTGTNDSLFLSGGLLGIGASWNWYTGTCGGVFIGTGNFQKIVPFVTTTYFLRAEGSCNSTPCVSRTIIASTISTAASSASATPLIICPGASVSLSSSGGSLGAGANWVWYSGSCGGQLAGTGISLLSFPTNSTMYFLRAVGACNTTNCLSVQVSVRTVSTSAVSISPLQPTICAGSSLSLIINGGVLGTGANWVWYSGSCGGTGAGTGSSLNVSPSVNTSYFIRAEGTCNTSSCISTLITVNSISTPPLSVTANPLSICSGDQTNLTISGGSLGSGSNWFWYEGNCNGTVLGTGSSISFYPTYTTTYYVRAQGICNTTTCVSNTILVNNNSVQADSIQSVSNIICSGATLSLTVSGGISGTGSTWNWYSGSCGGVPISTGLSIIISPTISITFFVRAEGLCNTTTCVSQQYTIIPSSTLPDSAFVLPKIICPGANAVLLLSGGFLGQGGKWYWYSGSCGGNFIGSATSVIINPTVSTSYFLRAAGNCNTTSCLSAVITVRTLSVAPDSISSTGSILCQGTSATFSINGGSPGSNGSWRWYLGSCGGTIVGTSATLIISPSLSGTYFVNALGACNTTSCKSVSITSVINSALPPDSVKAFPASICSGLTITLNSYSNQVGNLICQWYSGSCGGSLVGTGTIMTLTPTTTTSYYSRIQGYCNATTCKTLTVLVNSNSVVCSLSPIFPNICIGSTDVIHISGGSLGTGAKWMWYQGACGGQVIHSGNSLNIIPSVSTVYYIRAVGPCNTTSCSSCTISVDIVPNLSGIISGSTNVNYGFMETYSVTPVAGATYAWTAPIGWVGSSTNNSINYTCYSSGIITVTPTNSCGNGNTLSLFVNVLPVGISDIPNHWEIFFHNFPNPFDNFTFLEFEIPESGNINIELFNTEGKLVRQIADKFFIRGKNLIFFDATELRPGLYPCRIIYTNSTISKSRTINLIR